MSKQRVPPGGQHPEEWRQDLNPEAGAGANTGPDLGAQGPLTLGDIKEAHDRLQSLTKDELRSIPVLREGDRLEQGGTYTDLRERHPREFTAMGGQEAGRKNWYVRKDTVAYTLWDRLLGIDHGAGSVPGRAKE